MIPRILNTIKTVIEQPEPPPKKPQTPPMTEQEKDQVILGLPFYPDAVAKMLEARIRGKK